MNWFTGPAKTRHTPGGSPRHNQREARLVDSRALGGQLTQLTPPPLARAVLRWSLGHALPRTALRRSARQGDLHGRMFVATQSGDRAALEPVLDELRAHVPFYRGKFASVTADHATVRALLSNPDVGARFSPRTAEALLLGSWRGPWRRRRSDPHPALPVGYRASGSHPLPQVRVARLQRPGGREPAPPHSADRHRAPRPDRPEKSGRPRRDVLQPPAGHRDRGDPRRPGTRPREGAQVGCRGRAQP